MPRCPNCGKVNRDGSMFCQDCGTRLPEAAPGPVPGAGSGRMAGPGDAPGGVNCPACGAANQAGQNFCKQCGATLPKVPAPMPPRPGAPQAPPPGAPPGFGAPPPTAGARGGIAVCAHCGGETPPGMPFCQHCGQKLPGVVAAPPAPRGPSDAVAATIAAPGGQPIPPPPGAPAAMPTPPAGVRVGSGLTGRQPSGGAAYAPTMMPTSGQIDQILAAIPPRPGTGPTPIAAPPAAMPPPAPFPPPAAPQAPAEAEDSGRRTTTQPTTPAGPAPTSGATLVEQPAPTGRLVLVQSDGSDGTEYPLAGDQVDLGRTEGELTFSDDRFLAPRHARLERREERWVIAPLEARNGIFLRLREPADLSEADAFLVGKQVFRFERVPDIERDPAPAIEHGVHLFGTPGRQPWARLFLATTSGVARDIYYLTRAEIVLGREEGDYIFPDDEFMSRRHVAITDSRGRARMEDLGSSNGTYLRLKGERELRPGDMIRLGDQLLRFETID